MKNDSLRRIYLWALAVLILFGCSCFVMFARADRREWWKDQSVSPLCRGKDEGCTSSLHSVVVPYERNRGQSVDSSR